MTGIQDLTGAAVVVLAQTTILLAGIFAVSWCVRHRGPIAISLVSKAGLLGVIALCLAALLPLRRGPSVVQIPAPPQTAVFSPVTGGAAKKAGVSLETIRGQVRPMTSAVSGRLLEAPFASSKQVEPVDPPRRMTWPSAILGIWLLGTSVIFIWIGFAYWKLREIREASTQITGGLAFEQLSRLSRSRGVVAPELRVHPSATSPFLLGIFRTAIIADSSILEGLDSVSLDLIFEHELAHLRSNDCLWRLIERISCALLWPQPLLWFLCRRLDDSSEELCDQFVIANASSRRQYADCLLALAHGRRSSGSEQAFAVGVIPFRSAVGKRIARIMDLSLGVSTKISQRSRFGIGFLASVLVLSTLMMITGAARRVKIDEIPFDKGSDPKAVELFRQVQEAYKQLDSFSTTVREVNSGHVIEIYTLDFKRPGRAFVQVMGREVMVPKCQLYVASDHVTSTWPGNPKVYMVSHKPAGLNPTTGWGTSGSGLSALPQAARLNSAILPQLLDDIKVPKAFNAGRLSMGPDQVLNGEKVSTILLKRKFKGTKQRWEIVLTFLVRKSDHMLLGFSNSTKLAKSNISTTFSEEFERIRINPLLDDNEFTYSPPAGAKEITEYRPPSRQSPDVQKLLDQVTSAYRSLNSLNFEAQTDRGRLVVSFSRPKLLRMSLKMNWDGKEHAYLDSVSDGAREYVWHSGNTKQYAQNLDPNMIGRFDGAGLPMNVFYQLLNSISWVIGRTPASNLWGDLKVGPSGSVNGVQTDTIISTAPQFDQYGTPLSDSYSQITYSFGKQDHLLYGAQNHDHTWMDGKLFDRTDTESVIHLDRAPMPGSTFKFQPSTTTQLVPLKKLSPIYDGEQDTPISVGDKFPLLNTMDLQGKPFSLAQLRGKVVLIYAWTQGVENSETDLPKIQALFDKYRDQGFEAIGIACDGPESSRKYLKSKGAFFRNLPWGAKPSKGVHDKLKIHQYPFSYLIGRDGTVFAKDPWIPDLEPILRKALQAKA